KSAQIREILINESAWEDMTCLFAPSLVSPESCAPQILIYHAARALHLPHLYSEYRYLKYENRS
ncbi:hypothetical protein ACUTF3_25285, partial [Enterobacter hormaechei]